MDRFQTNHYTLEGCKGMEDQLLVQILLLCVVTLYDHDVVVVCTHLLLT